MILMECEGRREFEREKKFAASLVSTMTTGTNATSVSVVLFGNTTETLINNTQLLTPADQIKLVEVIQHQNFTSFGETNVTALLQNTEVESYLNMYRAETVTSSQVFTVGETSSRSSLVFAASNYTQIDSSDLRLLREMTYGVDVSTVMFSNATGGTGPSPLAAIVTSPIEENFHVINQQEEAVSEVNVVLQYQQNFYPGEN